MGRGRVLIWCVGFAAGIAAQGRLSLSPATWLATGALATVAALAAAVRGRTPALVVALLVAVSGGWWCAQADRRLDDGLDDFIGDGPVLVYGTVVGHPETADNRAHVVVQLTRVERDDVAVASRARLRLTVMDAPPLSYGDKIQVRTELRRPMPATNPGAFDYRSYLHRQGITLTAFVAHARHLSVAGRQPPNPFMYAGGVVRRWIQTGLSAALPPEAARVAGAVVMGDRRALSPDVEEQFRRAGVSHLLAVSGLHVGFLAAFGFALLQALRVPESWRTVAVLGLVWLYVLATGARAPAVRAGIMTTAATVAASSGRRDTPNALAAAALALLVHNPLLLFDASFQLSFTATAAIVWGYGPILERLRWLPRPVASAAAVTAAAQLGVTPLLAGTFHQLSVVGFVGSLVGSPVASLLVPVGLAAGVAGHVSALPSAWLGAAAALLADILTALAGRLASLSWAFIDVAPPPWTAVVAWWLFWWAVLRFRAPARRRRLALLAAATLAVVSLWSPLLGAWAPSELQLVFLDVGQGDAVLIRTPQGVTALVDGGGNVFSAARTRCKPGGERHPALPAVRGRRRRGRHRQHTSPRRPFARPAARSRPASGAAGGGQRPKRRRSVLAGIFAAHRGTGRLPLDGRGRTSHPSRPRRALGGAAPGRGHVGDAVGPEQQLRRHASRVRRHRSAVDRRHRGGGTAGLAPAGDGAPGGCGESASPRESMGVGLGVLRSGGRRLRRHHRRSQQLRTPVARSHRCAGGHGRARVSDGRGRRGHFLQRRRRVDGPHRATATGSWPPVHAPARGRPTGRIGGGRRGSWGPGKVSSCPAPWRN